MRGALCAAGLAAACALRVALGDGRPASAMPATLVFAAACLSIAGAAGWRPRRASRAQVALGAAGAAVLVGSWISARGLGGLHLAAPSASLLLWTPVVAAVAIAEEVLIRGALFDALRDSHGDAPALAATTASFALIHVPLYGTGALPLDLAVGLLLGALRLVSGGVAAPATAHVIADLAGGWLA